MLKKTKTKYGYEIKKVKIIGNDILLVTKDNIKVLDKVSLSPKNSFADLSDYQSISGSRIIVAKDECKVIDFLEDKVISIFQTNDISAVKLSPLVIAIGKTTGAISIHSVIGGKNLLNLNIFK